MLNEILRRTSSGSGLDLFYWTMEALSLMFLEQNILTEEKHTRAGHRILELNNLITGQELIIFSLQDYVYIKRMIRRTIISLLAMLMNVTY